MNHLTHSIEQRKQHFLALAQKVHGTTYDYSQVVYTKAQEKVEIVCLEHGSFLQTPDAHRNGRGCPKCGASRASSINSGKKSSLKTTEQFILDAQKVHGNTYDYSKTVYSGKINDVIITCIEHGDFNQRANNHLTGSGCPSCGVKKPTPISYRRLKTL